MYSAKFYRNAIEIDKQAISFLLPPPIVYDSKNYLNFIMHETEKEVLIPYTFFSVINNNVKKIFINRKYTPFINANPLVTPRTWQLNGLKKLKYNKPYKGIIKMPVGSGKTIFSLLLIGTVINKKTIVVVDKDILKSQWLESAKKVYGEQLSVKELEKEDFENKLNGIDIGVVNVQLLLSLLKDFQKYEPLIHDSDFDCVIYDEAHTTSAAKAFMRSLSLFRNFRYLFGLTATPKDEINEVMIGNVIIDAEQVGYYNKYKENLKIEFLKTNFEIPVKRWPGIDAQAFLANYYTSLENNKHFINFVVEEINRLLKENRKILLVVNRIKTLDLLKEKIPSIKILSSKQKDVVQESDNLVAATYNIASKGLDIDHLDTIVSLAIIRGKISTVQLIGRILRQKENKKFPLVKFIYDSVLLKHTDFSTIEEDIKSRKI